MSKRGRHTFTCSGADRERKQSEHRICVAVAYEKGKKVELMILRKPGKMLEAVGLYCFCFFSLNMRSKVYLED
jgi:hypothetical protein